MLSAQAVAASKARHITATVEMTRVPFLDMVRILGTATSAIWNASVVLSQYELQKGPITAAVARLVTMLLDIGRSLCLQAIPEPPRRSLIYVKSSLEEFYCSGSALGRMSHFAHSGPR